MAKNKIEKGVTLVAANTEVQGNISFQDQLYVNGRVVGNVVSEHESSAVVVSDEGVLQGEIHVPNVVINGRVSGDVYASNRLELAKNAHVTGNLYYNLVEMHLGARVEGQLVHQDFAAQAQENQGSDFAPLAGVAMPSESGA